MTASCHRPHQKLPIVRNVRTSRHPVARLPFVINAGACRRQRHTTSAVPQRGAATSKTAASSATDVIETRTGRAGTPIFGSSTGSRSGSPPWLAGDVASMVRHALNSQCLSTLVVARSDDARGAWLRATGDVCPYALRQPSNWRRRVMHFRVDCSGGGFFGSPCRRRSVQAGAPGRVELPLSLLICSRVPAELAEEDREVRSRPPSTRRRR